MGTRSLAQPHEHHTLREAAQLVVLGVFALPGDNAVCPMHPTNRISHPGVLPRLESSWGSRTCGMLEHHPQKPIRGDVLKRGNGAVTFPTGPSPGDVKALELTADRESLCGAEVPKIFMKGKTYGANQRCKIKYFLLYSFAPGFFTLNIQCQHMETDLKIEELLSLWGQSAVCAEAQTSLNTGVTVQGQV